MVTSISGKQAQLTLKEYIIMRRKMKPGEVQQVAQDYTENWQRRQNVQESSLF